MLAELTVLIFEIDEFEIANGFAIYFDYTRVFHEGCRGMGAGKGPFLIVLSHLLLPVRNCAVTIGVQGKWRSCISLTKLYKYNDCCARKLNCSKNSDLYTATIRIWKLFERGY